MKPVRTIKRRSDFVRAAKQGRRWVSQSMILQFLPEEGKQQVGFTVSKKVDKSAVRRNLIRRRLKAAASEIMPLAKEGTYVIIGRKEAAEKKFALLAGDLKWCLKRLDCIKDD